MLCHNCVIRCFKTLERWGDRLTGAAGPFFITFAVVLISMGTLSFFDVIYETLPYKLLTGPLCFLIAFNLWTHYYLVCTTPPGFVDSEPIQPAKTFPQSWAWARPRERERNGLGYRRLEEGIEGSGNDEWSIIKADMTKCRKCAMMRPERAHHCRICKRCVLKYDHHCPWINQCVGLYNERHFIMFMAYLWLATALFVLLGYHQFLDALGLSIQLSWPHHLPPVIFLLSFILSAVLSFAVGVMLLVALWSVMKGETSVEAQDNDVYRKVALSRGEVFGNGYDLGKIRNLILFFNIGENGYPLYTLFIPLRILPYTDGRAWARRRWKAPLGGNMFEYQHEHQDEHGYEHEEGEEEGSAGAGAGRDGDAVGEDGEGLGLGLGLGQGRNGNGNGNVGKVKEHSQWGAHRGVRRGEELTDEE